MPENAMHPLDPREGTRKSRCSPLRIIRPWFGSIFIYDFINFKSNDSVLEPFLPSVLFIEVTRAAESEKEKLQYQAPWFLFA